MVRFMCDGWDFVPTRTIRFTELENFVAFPSLAIWMNPLWEPRSWPFWPPGTTPILLLSLSELPGPLFQLRLEVEHFFLFEDSRLEVPFGQWLQSFPSHWFFPGQLMVFLKLLTISFWNKGAPTRSASKWSSPLSTNQWSSFGRSLLHCTFGSRHLYVTW